MQGSGGFLLLAHKIMNFFRTFAYIKVQESILSIKNSNNNNKIWTNTSQSTGTYLWVIDLRIFLCIAILFLLRFILFSYVWMLDCNREACVGHFHPAPVLDLEEKDLWMPFTGWFHASLACFRAEKDRVLSQPPHIQIFALMTRVNTFLPRWCS